MDPNRRCPNRLDQLKFTFGDLPPKEKEDYQELKSSITKVTELRELMVEMTALSQEVGQCQVNLTDKNKQVVPLIRDYENKLNVLKRKADAIKGEAKKKRKAGP